MRLSRLVAVLALLGWAQARAHPQNEVRLGSLPAWAREAMGLRLPLTQADAVLAFQELEVEPLATGGVREIRRYAAKVLKAPGLKRLGEDIAVYRRDDRVLFHRVWTVSPAGVARVSDEEEDVVDLPAVPDSGYSDVRLRIVRVPGLVVGGWMVSESSIVKALDLGAASHFFGDAEIPTVLSQVVLRTPPGWSRDWIVRRAPALEPTLAPDRASLALRDLAPLVREPLGPEPRDLLPLAWVRWDSPDGKRGFATWADVARWAGDLSEPVIEELGQASARAMALRPETSSTLLPALRAAFAHAARDVRYVSIQLGIGGYRPQAPAQVEATLHGDCKAKATLLRALVQSWGLKTFSVLVATRSGGEVDLQVPTPAQFNHMISAVALPPGIEPAPWATVDVPGVGRLLFLDPTASHGDAWDLRDDVQGTLALLVHPQAPQLVRLPVQPAGAAAENRVLRGKIDATGEFVEGRIEDSYTGTRAADIRGAFAGTSQQEHRDVVSRNVQDTIPGTTVTDYRIEGLQSFEGPVQQTLDLRGGKVAKRTGTLLIVEPGRLAAPLFTRLPAPPRRWPVQAGTPRRNEVEIVLDLPAGLEPEVLPAAASLDTGPISGTASWSFEDGRLVYRRQADLAGGTIAPEGYSAFRDAMRTVQAWDDSGIVLVPR